MDLFVYGCAVLIAVLLLIALMGTIVGLLGAKEEDEARSRAVVQKCREEYQRYLAEYQARQEDDSALTIYPKEIDTRRHYR